MSDLSDPYVFGRFCPICGLPVSPIGMITACPAHGLLMYLEASFGQEGDVGCSGCGRSIHKRYYFCPHCGKRVHRQ